MRIHLASAFYFFNLKDIHEIDGSFKIIGGAM